MLEEKAAAWGNVTAINNQRNREHHRLKRRGKIAYRRLSCLINGIGHHHHVIKCI